MEDSTVGLLETIVRGLVKNVDDVKIEKDESKNSDVIVYRVIVSEDDMGRIIGKQGRIAKSIRNIARAAAIKNNTKIAVEIG